MIAKYLSIFILLLNFLSPCLFSQTEDGVDDEIKVLRSDAYRCLIESKSDSALTYTQLLLDFASEEKITTYKKAKQFGFAAYIHEQLGNAAQTYMFADTACQMYLALDSINADLANGLWTKGTALLRLGDSQGAKDNLERALSVAIPIEYYVSNIRNDLADSYYSLGELSKSKELYNLLLENPDQLSPMLAMIVSANLTDIYLTEENLNLAAKTWRPVEDKLTSGQLEGFPQLHDLLVIKSKLQSKQSEYESASATIEKAIQAHQLYNAQNLRDLIKLYCNKTEIALLQKDSETAFESIQLAEKIVNDNKEEFSLDPHNMVVQYLKAKSASRSFNELDSTLLICKKTQDISEKIRLNLLHEKSKLGITGYVEDNIALGLDAAFEQFQNTKDMAYIEDVFYFMDKSRSQILLDEMAERIWSQQNALSIIKEIKNLEIQKTQQAVSSEVDRLGLEIERAKKRLRDQFGQTYSDLTKQQSYVKIQDYVDKNDLSLLIFGAGEKHSYVLLMQKGEVQLRKIDTENQELLVTLEKFNADLNNVNAPASRYAENATHLYESIFSDLKIDNKRICIIPSSIFQDVSFASFVCNYQNETNYKKLPYLSNTNDIEYALSTYFLTQNTMPKGDRIAIVDRESQYGNLNSHNEMLKAVWSEDKENLFEATDKKQFEQKLGNASIVHISSHGFFDENDAMESYIVLPGADDFNYTIKDIYESRIEGSPLVVLNSCETGKGHALKGEGSNNFTRAFTYSGASAVIENAWKINAYSTSEIFAHFYKNIKSGDNSTVALSSALRQYRSQENMDDSFSHPYYWSGFKHYGNPVKVKQGSMGLMVFLSVLFLCILALYLIFSKNKGIGSLR